MTQFNFLIFQMHPNGKGKLYYEDKYSENFSITYFNDLWEEEQYCYIVNE